jgi:tRNA U34 5-carboxymethylaminomethyl modifying enzyme MnmG/GidA
MSCNPAMGGIAKVKLYEKLMPWVVIRGISDRTAIQFKMLNKSRGQLCGHLVCNQIVCALLKNGG